MKSQKLIISLLIICLLVAGGYELYHMGMSQGMNMKAPDAMAATMPAEANKTGGKKVLYWHDPMYPTQKFDKPGKSPFMDMQLEPVYAEDSGDEGSVSISSRVQQNLGVRTTEVVKGTLESSLEAVGTVDYNDRDVALVQARSNGFVEKLYVRAPLDPVRKGQALAELYVPDWVAAQEEYLSILRMNLQGSDGLQSALREGALQRMRLAGMSDEQIRQIASGGKVQSRITVTAPSSGVITELSAREGMTVMAGAPLFRINGLATVWVNAEIPESAAAQVRPGNAIEAHTPALPDAVFKGKVSALLPQVDAPTRTLKARIEIANRNAQLVPGMFVTVNLTPSTHREALLVPTEAVIQTGKRNVVIVAQEDGKFAPVDVELGRESNGQTEICKGLQLGQKVVVSGQFLVDSEASLRGTTTRMGESSMMDEPMTDESMSKEPVMKQPKMEMPMSSSDMMDNKGTKP
jgi:Cu(I)/Ag(I) efflux system membrane fusion protein